MPVEFKKYANEVEKHDVYNLDFYLQWPHVKNDALFMCVMFVL